MFGWTAEEAIGMRLSVLMIPPAMRERHEAGRARMVVGGGPKIMNRQIEMSALRKDGREIPAELSVWPIKLEKPPCLARSSAIFLNVTLPRQHC